MNALIATSGQYGPFSSIEKSEDRWICDGVEYQFSVIGDASIGEYVLPPSLGAQTIEPTPTKEELLAELQTLTAKIQALG